jgi:hypothetical protein
MKVDVFDIDLLIGTVLRASTRQRERAMRAGFVVDHGGGAFRS